MPSDVTLRLIALLTPALAGVACGALKLFRAPHDAVGTLNRYALNIGFPALVALGLALADLSVAARPAFWLLWPLALGVGLASVRLTARARSAPLALVLAFGNIAYLGLPYVRAVLGEEASATAAVLVAVHVSIAVSAGPYLLRRWSGADAGGAAARILRTPLVWAPVAGLAIRALPDTAAVLAHAALQPLADSAAPVALFLLGLYLHTERRRLARPTTGARALVLTRLALAPGLVLALALACVRAGWLAPEAARVHVVLAAMPVAITTFSIALDAEAHEDDVGASIVWSTVLAALWLPAWTALVQRILPG